MADFLKDFFGDKGLTFDEFSGIVKEKGLNLADLSTGKYVSVDKFNAEVVKHKKQYEELAGAIDGDSGLKKQIETLKSEKSDFETKYKTTSSELNSLKNAQKIVASGVSGDMAGFVNFEVSKLVNDSLDFDTALKGYLTNNPQFLSKQEKVKVRTSPKADGGSAKTETVNTKMNEAFLKATGRI